jgi:hypothetical protein
MNLETRNLGVSPKIYSWFHGFQIFFVWQNQ